MNVSDLLMQVAVKATVLLAAAFAAAYLLRNASAALRHYLWTIVFAALLLLPAAMRSTPQWSLASSETASPANGTVSVTAERAARRSPAPPRPDPLPWIYAAGVIAVAIRFLAGTIRTRRLLAGASRLDIDSAPRHARILECPHAPVPLVWGVVRPIIALPS